MSKNAGRSYGGGARSRARQRRPGFNPLLVHPEFQREFYDGEIPSEEQTISAPKQDGPGRVSQRRPASPNQAPDGNEARTLARRY